RPTAARTPDVRAGVISTGSRRALCWNSPNLRWNSTAVVCAMVAPIGIYVIRTRLEGHLTTTVLEVKHTSAIPSIASGFCRVCGWRPVNKADDDLLCVPPAPVPDEAQGELLATKYWP